jgi:hypothetical protein
MVAFSVRPTQGRTENCFRPIGTCRRYAGPIHLRYQPISNPRGQIQLDDLMIFVAGFPPRFPASPPVFEHIAWSMTGYLYSFFRLFLKKSERPNFSAFHRARKNAPKLEHLLVAICGYANICS